MQRVVAFYNYKEEAHQATEALEDLGRKIS